MAFYFEQLNVYQRAVKLAEALCKDASGIQTHRAILDVVITDALAVPALIAGASRHWEPAERKLHYGSAVGAGYGLVSTLEVVRRMGIIPDKTVRVWQDEIEGLTRTLGALIASIAKRPHEAKVGPDAS